MKKFSLIFYILTINFCFSQVKNEREERIERSNFPKIAQHYFDKFIGESKYLKFYKETDGKKISYEAKLKINGRHYSVEFDTEGKLEDVEIIIKERHIAKEARQKINYYLSKQYKKSRLLKIQKQYINDCKLTDKAFIAQIIENPGPNYIHYEIIAEVITKDERLLKELTFTDKGRFIGERVVTFSSYDHALY